MTENTRSTTEKDAERDENIGVYRAKSVPRDHTDGYLYFVTCDYPDFPIKIGFAVMPKSRVIQMQTSLPYRVVTLATIRGTRITERKILRRFKHLRLRGEWFRRDQSLLDAIEDAKRGVIIDPEQPEEVKAHLRRLRDRPSL